ncbi:hypothetical protein LX36DRAFT_587942 [Colletotrichum falcatum]|nr:hypothetical protein LX36DRAFT_587942 [Colletotrichum falcatum]
MTKSLRGPSLPQARSYHHNHYHLHNKRAAVPENAHHQHRQLDVAAPAPADAQLSTTPGSKTVVETISVIQIVDASGLPIQLQTLYPTSVTVDASAAISAALDLSTLAVLSPSSTGESALEAPTTSSGATLSTPVATTPSSTSSSAGQGTSLTSDPLSTTQAPSGPEGGGSGMIQRSLSYGPGAAAVGSGATTAASKHSRRASEPSETGERGFVRVSGRKLPSVLQSGGDGYTDPHEGLAVPFGGAANDDESIYYRNSQAFFDPGGEQTPRLALGSPMRPVSGVVVFKDSPARTPVTESTPFAGPNTSLSPPSPPPARDPIGRTLPSQDGSRDSRGSASRFQEQM